MPPMVPAFRPGHFIFTAFQNENGSHGFLTFEGLIDILFQGDDFSPSPCTILGNDALAGRIVETFTKAVGTESSKDHRVGGTDAGTGEHGDGDFGNHAHVNGDGIPFADSQLLQGGSALTHFGKEFRVSEAQGIAGLPFPMEGDPVGVRLDVAIETGFGHIQTSTLKPPVNRSIRGIEETMPGLSPVNLFGLAGPEGQRIPGCFLVYP